MRTIKLKPLIGFLAIPLLVGGISALVSKPQELYSEIVKPPLAPPSIIFPIVWTILFILMGISAYLVYTSDASDKDKKKAIFIWGVQLVLNFMWSILFFNLNLYFISFIWLILLFISILIMIIKFFDISKLAGLLQIPYLLWVSFALYLNWWIFVLN